MGFLDDIKKGLGDLAGEASKQADVARLKLRIDELTGVLTQTEAEAGRRVRDRWQRGGVSDAELVNLCERMKSLEGDIAELHRQIEAAKQGRPAERLCSGCQQVVAAMDEFCARCGRKLPVCAQCLQPLSALDEFCPGCGQKVASA